MGAPGHNTQGFGQWLTGPNAGLVERLQNGVPGTDPSGDIIHRWEHLITFAGTSFYRGGTLVPFVAVALDPVNDNVEALWNMDYFYTNNFIITLQQKFFTQYGSGFPSDDPWGAGGRNHRRVRDRRQADLSVLSSGETDSTAACVSRRRPLSSGEQGLMGRV